MDIKRFIPKAVKTYFAKRYVDILFKRAIDLAEENYRKDGRRYFVFPTTSGDFKVTNGDFETRDRIRDKRLLKKPVRYPYQLRREAFYFTASDKCKNKYISKGLDPWAVEAMKPIIYEWYFRYH